MKKPRGMTYRRNAIYAVYKGEDLLATGTQDECAAELGVTPHTIHFWVTPTGKKRTANRKYPDKATTADVIDWEENS